MEKNTFNVTQQELDTMKGRTEDVIRTMANCNSGENGFLKYAMENGYTAEEARSLADTVVSTVDLYNRECLAHVGDISNDWIIQRVNERTDGMSLADECKYKLGILIALRAAGKELLGRAANLTADQMDAMYADLTDRELIELEDSKYTENMLAKINDNLAEAIGNCGIELEMSGQMERLIDGEMDADSVHGFVTEMWQDEQYKYAVATAACVAKKNGELPSIPEDTTDTALIIGVCQGVDAANIEMRVASGEMLVDKAYQILKTIATVGLVILTLASMVAAGLILASATVSFVVDHLGTGLIASLLAVALGGAVLFTIGDDFVGTVKTVTNIFHRLSDFTYDHMKKGAKAIYEAALKHVVPCVKHMIEIVTEHIRGVFSSIRHAFGQTRADIRNA